MRTIKALGRLIKTFFLVIIGKADRKSARVAKTPDAMRGGYNEVIRDKAKLVSQLTEAISTKFGSRASKMDRLEALQKQNQKLRAGQAGALSLAKKRAEELNNDPVVLLEDDKYKQCRQAYTNKENAIKSLEARVEELEGNIEEDSDIIEDQKRRLIQMRSELQSLVDERDDAIADVISAKADEIANASLANIPSDDSTAERLRTLREARRNAKASAQVVKEIAETDTHAFDAALEREGRIDEASSEFDALVTGVELTSVVSGADALELASELPIQPKVDEEVTVGDTTKS